jgi:hypothetical protein
MREKGSVETVVESTRHVVLGQFPLARSEREAVPGLTIAVGQRDDDRRGFKRMPGVVDARPTFEPANPPA